MSNKALLIIDVQNGMFLEDDPVHNGAKLIDNLKHLIKQARSKNVAVFYIQHNESAGPLEHGTNGWEIHPELTPMPGDVIVQKDTPDSFFNTSLEAELKKRGITHLFLTGIQSEICVDTTCRRAFSMGYDVTIASDVHGTWANEELTAQQIINHHNQVLRWFVDVKETGEIEF